MGIIRVLVCLFLPPLAVLDKGCGSFLLVLLLSLAGWVPGVLAALFICGQTPGGGSYMAPLSGRQWRRLMGNLPPRSGTENDATDRQMGILWDLGLRDESFLGGLGISQAGWLIDSGRRASGGMGCVAGLLFILLVLGVGYGVKRMILDRTEAPVVEPATTLPTGGVLPGSVTPATTLPNGGGPGSVVPATTLPSGGVVPGSVKPATSLPSGGTQPGSVTPATTSARDRAMLAFPQLAVLNSPLNREFVRRYNLYLKEHREYFQDPDWPTKLARESAAAIAPR